MAAQHSNETNDYIYLNEFGRIMFQGKVITDCNKDELMACICRLHASYTKLQEMFEGQLYSGSKISEGKFTPLNKRK
jgi:hypothetical protein